MDNVCCSTSNGKRPQERLVINMEKKSVVLVRQCEYSKLTEWFNVKLRESGAAYCLLPGGWMSGWVHTVGGLFLVTAL